MLTGQFNELYDSIGSGVPVRIHKLDNNGTVMDLKVDCFSRPEEIPYPWSDHPWSDSFIGYSISRNSLKRADIITSPVELYCFYDADVTLTFKLPIPGAKAVSIQYSEGQYPQLHDINGDGVILADCDQRVSLCLPDGSDIDGMVKPAINTEIEVLICNKPDTFSTNSAVFAGNGTGYGLEDGRISTFNKFANMPEVNITPVSFDIPKSTSVTVAQTTYSFGKYVPYEVDIFGHNYTVNPLVSEVTGTGYLQAVWSASDYTITTKLVKQQSGVDSVGFIFGSVTNDVPTSFPSGDPSLVGKSSIVVNGATYYGFPIREMTMKRGQCIPFRSKAKLVSYQKKLSISVTTENIIMNGLPNGVSSWFSSPRLRDWIEQGSDASVSEWWGSNYSSIFYSH